MGRRVRECLSRHRCPPLSDGRRTGAPLCRRRWLGSRTGAASGGTPSTPSSRVRRWPPTACWRRSVYQQTDSAFALAQARKFLAGPTPAASAATEGLYADSSVSTTPVDYIEAPLIYAQALLCHLTGTAAECERARQLQIAALRRFGYLLDFSPQYDAIYLQWMLALYSLEGDTTLYLLAADNARDAQTRALNSQGLYLLSWNGETLPAIDAQPGMLQTQAATTSLFAWLAVYPPPT